MRIKYRWQAIQDETYAIEEVKRKGKAYKPDFLANEDSKRQLLVRSRYLLLESAKKWTERQKERAEILFELYPDPKKEYGLSHSLRMIFAKNMIKDAARVSLAKWYNKVEEASFNSFNVIVATLYEHYQEVYRIFHSFLYNIWTHKYLCLKQNFTADPKALIHYEKLFHQKGCKKTNCSPESCNLDFLDLIKKDIRKINYFFSAHTFGRPFFNSKNVKTRKVNTLLQGRNILF